MEHKNTRFKLAYIPNPKFQIHTYISRTFQTQTTIYIPKNTLIFQTQTLINKFLNIITYLTENWNKLKRGTFNHRRNKSDKGEVKNGKGEISTSMNPRQRSAALGYELIKDKEQRVGERERENPSQNQSSKPSEIPKQSQKTHCKHLWRTTIKSNIEEWISQLMNFGLFFLYWSS